MSRFFAVLACQFALLTAAHAQQISPCEQAGRDAEHQYALPAGLLGAIGRVESGRWDATLGRVVPSPNAIDAAGVPLLPSNKQAAVQQIQALQNSGTHNIDVGCFQISLLNHPAAFTNLDQALDPAANADYAARFLTSLRDRLGNWEDAVAAYHSATPSRGIPYKQLVLANWTAPQNWRNSNPPPPALPLSREENSAVPVKVFSINGSEIRVWTPSRAGSAASSLSTANALATATLPTVTTGSLPRIVTPGG